MTLCLHYENKTQKINSSQNKYLSVVFIFKYNNHMTFLLSRLFFLYALVLKKNKNTQYRTTGHLVSLFYCTLFLKNMFNFVLLWLWKLDFSRKKLYPLMRILIFFLLNPRGFPVKFTVTPLEFSIFLHWPPALWKSMIFLNFWCTSLEFQRLLLYPLELSINILNRRVTIFFSGKAHS